MEVADQRTPDDQVGPVVATGRDAAIHDAGPGLVLRRTPDRRDLVPEGRVMEHVRAHGYPVPRVVRVAPGEMVLERVEGPTMLADLGAHPWRAGRHARTLAQLHDALHAIPAPPGLRDHPVEGTAIVHLDLHPGNVILAPTGPVVIDWTNARRSRPEVDVADTWLLVHAFGRDEAQPSGSLPARALDALVRRAEPWVRRWFLAVFLRATGLRGEAATVLAQVAATREADHHTASAEVQAMTELVAREAPTG